MKKTIAITSALAAVTGLATAEIKINDFLSFEGFVDMSYSHTDTDIGGDKDSSNSFDIDQVEIDWLFNFGKVSGRIDLAYEGGDYYDDDTVVEQAFASYDLGNGNALTAGRYQSMLGLEAFEPTGLYQWSFAYDMAGLDTSALPGYAQGVKYTSESNGNFFGLSIQDQANETDPSRLGGDGDSSYGIEAAFSTELSDATTVFLGGSYEDADAGDTSVINAYLTHETGAWVFGAEVVVAESDNTVSGLGDIVTDLGLGSVTTDEEVLQAMIMANYAYSDCCSITGRISYTEHEADVDGSDADVDAIKYTLAHNYAATDNLAIITEVSYVDADAEGTDIEALQGAVEVLFSF